MEMDEKDRLILFELLQDCRQPISKIAKAVNLPQQTTSYRIKKLEDSKVIKKYTTNINYPKLGFSRHSIYLDIKGVSAEDVDKYLKQITGIEEVSCCYMLHEVSQWKLYVSVWTKTIERYDEIQTKIMSKFKDKVISKSVESNMQKLEIVNLAHQECSCGKGFSEGFCYICNEPVCSECAKKERMHFDCIHECKDCKKEAKCNNCLRDVCSECSKEAWAHFPENCIKNKDKMIVGILEVTHDCWFSDLSKKLKNPIMLNSFIDEKDKELGTHSGSILIENADKEVALSHIVKHKQIVEVKPIQINDKLILRTRALFNKSVEDFVRKNKSILLNPVLAHHAKERNLIISPSRKEIVSLLKGLSKHSKCKISAIEEVEIQNINSIKSEEIIPFINSVDRRDLQNAIQRIRVMKRLVN